jgi:hypothetical protein
MVLVGIGQGGGLVTVFAAASAGDLLVHHIATALTDGTVMLALALVIVIALIVRPREAAVIATSTKEK